MTFRFSVQSQTNFLNLASNAEEPIDRPKDNLANANFIPFNAEVNYDLQTACPLIQKHNFNLCKLLVKDLGFI